MWARDMLVRYVAPGRKPDRGELLPVSSVRRENDNNGKAIGCIWKQQMAISIKECKQAS